MPALTRLWQRDERYGQFARWQPLQNDDQLFVVAAAIVEANLELRDRDQIHVHARLMRLAPTAYLECCS